MRRRDFLAGIGGAAAAWPLAARAQQPTMPVVGFLSSADAESYADRVRAFRQGLSATGFVEGRNVAFEFRWADGRNDQLRALAVDLVRRQVAVIAASSDTGAHAAKAATTSIPIVFNVANDPVAHGLVASLNRPGGNMTGVTNLNVEMMPKRLDILRELMPGTRIMGALINPTASNAAAVTRQLIEASRLLGIQLNVLHASTLGEIDTAFASFIDKKSGAIVIGGDAFFNSRSEQLGMLSIRYRVPSIFQTRVFVVSGGLLSYAGSILEEYRLTGIYTGRILKGEKPTDLPVMQATKTELILNLRTARALGIDVPTGLLVRADEVIE